MRSALALAGAACWIAILTVEAWLGSRLLASDVVAGLVSPQGATLSGLLAVGSFVLLRLLAVLALPSAVAALVVWAGAGLSTRPSR